MRTVAMMVLALAALAGPLAAPLAAQEGQEGQGRAEAVERRMQLEQEVRQRFVRQVARRLQLTDPQREAFTTTLRQGAEARRELAEESRALRRELLTAVRDDAAPLSTYERLLERLQAIRESERRIERREEARLAEVLDARQRAVYLIMRMQFNDRVRGVRGPPAGRRPGGGGDRSDRRS